MQLAQLSFDGVTGWTDTTGDSSSLADAQLVLVFGDRPAFEAADVIAPLRARFPLARVVACSSGGEILGDRVLEGAITATVLDFESSRIVAVERVLAGAADSAVAGEALARALPGLGLRHVIVFSEGLHVNGSPLAGALSRALPPGVAVTGGLAADGERFERTLVGLDERPAENRVVAIGFYGARLEIGMGSLGGWQTSGTDLVITRAEGNVLHELNGEPALEVYKRLIGAHAYGLPATGLLYPLEVRGTSGEPGVVRTLLGVDESAGTLTFAGDLPKGRSVRLMRANLEQLIDAAGTAATRTVRNGHATSVDFALLISCIGRKLLLQKRVQEEVVSARHAFGPRTTFAGFYSYGELSPAGVSTRCELHNQTMTITTLSER